MFWANSTKFRRTTVGKAVCRGAVSIELTPIAPVLEYRLFASQTSTWICMVHAVDGSTDGQTRWPELIVGIGRQQISPRGLLDNRPAMPPMRTALQ